MKIGDKVRIKSDLKVGNDYDDAEFTEEMVKYLGKSATIIEVIYDDWQYGLDIDNNFFAFTNDMLDLVVSKDKPLKVKYKNWKGEVGIRTIIPLKVLYGHTDFHKTDQWLMEVWDIDKDAPRTYAMLDIVEFIKE